jgi:hypothetical protein
MTTKLSTKPCPICREMGIIIGTTSKGKKLMSCGHSFRFKRTKSQKDLDRGYIKTEWGLEKITKEK